MKKATVLFCLLFCFHAWGLDKNLLDVDEERDELNKSSAASSTTSFGHRFLSTEYLELSLMTGGAFTIGTNKGANDSPFDDASPLSFGHPYALTSYPLIAMDGEWKRLDQWCSDWTLITPQIAGGVLFLEAVLQERLDFRFSLQTVDQGKAIVISISAKNVDAASHSVGLALVYDPAMGAGGDGHARFGQMISNPTAITNAAALASFTLSERPQAPFGLKMDVMCTTLPDRALVSNWPEIYEDNSLQQPLNTTAALFDLCLKLIWDARPLASGEERTATLKFELVPADFSSAAFLRWNMPMALTLENNVLFPRRMLTMARVMNSSSSSLTNLQLAVDYPQEFNGTLSADLLSVSPQASAFPTLEVKSKEIYEDKIVPITLTLHRGAEIMDQLLRYVFIPATPVSDVGLTVTIDSVATQNHPAVSLVMRAEVSETGAKLLNLMPENVFLYENDRRVPEFAMKKFAGGGATMADVCFVLDCSGSMGDEIDQVRNYLGEFADSLARRGFDFRVAVVTFSTTVDKVWDFTQDINAMKRNLASVLLWGGVEDSPGAMRTAADQLSWRTGSKRTIIWVTDEPYPENIQKRDPLINTLLAKGITVHGVGPLELQTEWFNPIVIPTGGNFYNIAGNFRDILLDVSREKTEDRYLLSYTSQISRVDLHMLSIQVRYAGLGGQAMFQVDGGLMSLLSCFPNPFNPTITLRVQPFDGQWGRLDIYNLLGQRVRSFHLQPDRPHDIVWDARDERNVAVSAGLYGVMLTINTTGGVAQQQQQRILYVK